ncbi:MAG: dynamin family protein, partial [Pseudomonadota bacterium]|nr:dynamin family protein [Pseudomonadota bacterium]
MNADSFIPLSHVPSVNAQLLARGTDSLARQAQRLRPLRDALGNIARLGDKGAASRAEQLRRQLDAIEPGVTMIGQIKAGKTMLINAMAGWPGLLPSDVNPWTSVVTSLHLAPRPLPNGPRARFRFFDRGEWDHLVAGGGRIGELAGRAGAEDELEKIRRQVARMREKSAARLGDRFELLLGQEHSYDHFDPDLIERYVCLGDDFGEQSDDQGRFADITKSADLRLHCPSFPMPFCIRDTPGVNDTFMVREQITIGAIRQSRICVVVLSAHQALSSTDLALIRMISNVKSRELIIFVNRIDELADPVQQVPQIENSIRDTLQRAQNAEPPQILFGSALWANFALSGAMAKLPRASAEALYAWAESGRFRIPAGETPQNILWDLSGVPALYEAIGTRASEGTLAESVDRIATAATNLANGIEISERLIAAPAADWPVRVADPQAVMQNCDAIVARHTQAAETRATELTQAFSDRIDRALATFLDRATAALVAHLDTNGDQQVWTYDPAGLRALLASACTSFGAAMTRAQAEVMNAAAADLAQLTRQALSLPDGLYDITPPPAPRVPPPVSLA